MKVGVFTPYYLPGYKGGGPIRSLANMVDQLGGEFHFSVITADRDFGTHVPYDSVSSGTWLKVGKAEVLYLSPEQLTVIAFWRLLRTRDFDVIHLNSLLSPTFTVIPLLLRRLSLFPKVPVIVAPRGELSPSALSIKPLKKNVYLRLAKALGLYNGVLWQASSPLEESDIRRWFGAKVPVMVAPDLSTGVPICADRLSKEKRSGVLRAVFLSRISRMKNLHGALGMLRGIQGKVQFDICGPIEDPAYWNECLAVMAQLAENVSVTYRGDVPHEEVVQLLSTYDLLFLPTLGENFGHVIVESLIAGCPVLVSDRTPWRYLEEAGAGWDLPLEEVEEFRRVLQQFVRMDDQTHSLWRYGARRYGLKILKSSEATAQNRALLRKASSMSERNVQRY